MGNQEKKPIFIHSLFRTGSTYLWNKFRQDGRYYCYYEPFNQIIGELNTNNPAPLSGDENITTLMRHPILNRDYLFEYQPLCTEGPIGIPYFKKSFSFDNFCNNETNPEQKKYVDFLIENTGGKIPLLQFNRSALRIGWFKKYYASSLHMYLVRNPFDQFCSYLSMAEEQGLDIFLIMDLITTGVNRNKGIFRELARHIPLLEYHGQCFRDEEFVYRQLLPIYSTEEKYFIFYYIWFAALVENLLNSSLILNINFLSSSAPYRAKFNQHLQTYHIDNMDFSDCKIQAWTKSVLAENKRTKIQETIQSLIWSHYSGSEIAHITANLDNENRAYFNISNTDSATCKTIKIPEKELSKIWAQKCDSLCASFSNTSVQLLHQINDLIQKMAEIQPEMRLLNQKLLEVSKKLNQKEHELLQANQQLMSQTQALEKNNQELALKTQELILKEQQLTKTHELLVTETLELEKTTEKLALQSAALATKDRRVAQLTRELQEKETCLNTILNKKEFKLGKFLMAPFSNPPKRAKGENKAGGLRIKGDVKKSLPNRPLITVITVVLNEPVALQKTMNSIFGQTYDNIEYIIIDGLSSEATLTIIKENEDKIDYWISEKDKGIFDAMNKGIELATGDWINFMNAGDYFFQNDTVSTVFQKPYGTADFIYGDTFFLGGDYYGVVKCWDLNILWQTMVFTHQSLFTHRRILKARQFDTTFKICADYDLIYSSYMQGKKFFNAGTVISAFDPGFSDVNRAKLAYEKWKVVKKYRHDVAFHMFYLKLFINRYFRDRRKRREKATTSFAVPRYDDIFTNPDISLTSGFRDKEGPYPALHLPRVRWGLGPESIIQIHSNYRSQKNLLLHVKSLFPADQTITIMLNDQPIAELCIEVSIKEQEKDFHVLSIPVDLVAGINVVRLTYNTWKTSPTADDADQYPLAVLFSKIEIAE